MDATLASSEKTEDSHKVDLELDDQPEARLMSFKKPIRNEEHPLPVSLPHQWGGNGVAFAALSHRGGRTGADPVPYKSEGTLRQAQGERNDLQHQRKSFRNVIHDALPITQQDYFTLVDTTGRLIREDKAGHISSELKPILKRFNIDPEQFMDQVQHFHERYAHCAGAPDNITAFAETPVPGRGDRGLRKLIENCATKDS